VRIKQLDGCGEQAFLIPSGARAAVNTVSQISEMAQQLRRVLGARAVHGAVPSVDGCLLQRS